MKAFLTWLSLSAVVGLIYGAAILYAKLFIWTETGYWWRRRP